MYRNRAARQKRRQRVVDEQVGEMSKALDGMTLSGTLEDNVALMQQLFTDVDVFRVRRLENEKDSALRFALMFCDGMINPEFIEESIIRPLVNANVPDGDLIDHLTTRTLKVTELKKTEDPRQIVDAVSYGDTVLFVEGTAQAVLMNTKQFETRAVAEPESERSLTGPREGFNENLMTNLSLLRRKVRSNELKMKMRVFGKRTRTQACVCYMEGLVNKSILAELQRRLDSVDIDGVLDSNYLAELIRDSRTSIFRTTGLTERPDVVIGKLLEGRIAVLVDGSPVALTVPYLLIESFQSNEDYYYSYYYSSFSRLLRIFGFFLTVAVPGFYIAIVAFHHEMLPTQLMINMATERNSVPLPAALEALAMLIVFDLLRETGARMPGNIGQALSIVGALVIGQAAVEAKMVAAPMIIVVALTGITAMLVPKLNASIIYIRFLLLLLASMFGFYGLALGASAVLIHVINLRSFGVQVLTLTGDLNKQEVRDTWVRDPWWLMKLRPRMAADRARMKNGGGGQ
jgi:spore germination protein KA